MCGKLSFLPGILQQGLKRAFYVYDSYVKEIEN